MNKGLIIFSAQNDNYRAAFAVRISSFTARPTLIATATTIDDLSERLRTEPHLEFISLENHRPEHSALRDVADDFFVQLAFAVQASIDRREKALRKAAHWRRVEEVKLALDDAARTEKDRRRLADAIRHQRRHLAAASAEERFVFDAELPWRNAE